MAALIALCFPTGDLRAEPTSALLSIAAGGFEVEPSVGTAGAHADLSISVAFPEGESGHPRTVVVELPPGFVGNSGAVPVCPRGEFFAGLLTPSCPPASQVGTVAFAGNISSTAVSAALPLYSLAPAEPGVAAELGFRFFDSAQFLPISLRSSDGGMTVTAPAISADIEPSAIALDVWAVPAAPSHDPERGRFCTQVGGEPSCQGGEEAAEAPQRPFLANPTACGSAVARIRADSWEEPQEWAQASADAGPISDCEAVRFEPELEAATTAGAADSPSGFTVSLDMPSAWEDPEGLVSSALESARLALPAGFSLNPASTAGLTACTPAQLGRETTPVAAGEGCPEGSIVGSVRAESPILGEPAIGSIYLAQPFDNPTGARLAVYAVAKAPGSGIVVELTGRLELDPSTGQVVAVIERAPQLPIERLTLRLGTGSTPVLAAPMACGQGEAAVALTPWSGPSQPLRLGATVEVNRAAAGGPCPPAGSLPFAPGLRVASATPVAGANAPLSFQVRREDGEAPLADLALRLPRGVGARLAGVAQCPQSALEAAASASAAAELAHRSCPAASWLGHAGVEVGVGPAPATLSGDVYLAGPDAGSPLSMAMVLPARLGPLDLGTVVVREPLRLDPGTGALVVGSDALPLPSIVAGVPLRLRGVDVSLDRPELVHNPTSCTPKLATATLGGAAGGTVETAVVSDRFSMRGCRRLRFAPTLGLRLIGTGARNGRPGLHAVLVSHPDEANLARARIALPPGVLLDPTAIGRICGVSGFALRRCPPASIRGWARASSPLLGEPLRGPVYLRRDPGAPLPELVAALRSTRFEIQLVAKLAMASSGLYLTIEGAPDLPLSKLDFAIAGGRRGLLVASHDLCEPTEPLAVRLVGHNGKVMKLPVALHGGCDRPPGAPSAGRTRWPAR